MCSIFVEILGFFMFMVKLCIYLCMYLLQVISHPPPLGIESDLFQCIQLAKEVQLEPAVVTGSVADPLFSAVSLTDQSVSPSKMRLGCGNPAH